MLKVPLNMGKVVVRCADLIGLQITRSPKVIRWRPLGTGHNLELSESTFQLSDCIFNENLQQYLSADKICSVHKKLLLYEKDLVGLC